VAQITNTKRTVVMTLLVVGYVATDVWLYSWSKMTLSDRLLLDVFITLGFVILGAIAFAITRRGSDDIKGSTS
jgi:hypothetical protein